MVYGIILSAGSGKRMNSDIKKQYIELEGKPIIYYALEKFDKSNVDGIILVTSVDDEAYVREQIINKYNFEKKIDIVYGGKERYDSVFNALKCAKNAKYVLIHDGARPFATTELINQIIDSCRVKEACLAAVRVKDTIKKVKEGCIFETVPRGDLWQIQTPQGFNYEKLYRAYKKMYEENSQEGVTDDSMVWEKYEKSPVHVIESEYSNIKITTKEDLLYGRSLIKSGFEGEKS